MWRYDVVDVAATRSDERVGEFLAVLLGALRDLCFVADILAKDYLYCTLRAHHRNLCARPCKVDVAAQMLGRHHVIRAAVRLASDNRDLGHSRFCIREQQLGAVLDDATVFLRRAGHESGHVHERDDRNIERVAKTHKATRLDRRFDIKAPSLHERLIGHDADRVTVHPREADDDVLRMIRLELTELPVIDDLVDDFFNIVGLVRVVRHKRIEGHLGAIRRVRRRTKRRFFAVVGRQIIDESAHHHYRLDIILERHVADAGNG